MSKGDIIKELRIKAGLTQTELADALNTTKQAIYKYETNVVTNIPSDKIETMSKIFNVSPAYIMGWSDDIKPAIPNIIKPDSNEKYVNIPVVGRVAAGMGCLAEDNIIDYEPITRNSLTQGEDYVFLRVIGDSMYPEFKEGDLVLVRCQTSVDSGDYAVVIIDGEDGVIKKVVYGDDFIELRSINPMYPPRRFEGKDVLRVSVYGLVREIKRKF